MPSTPATATTDDVVLDFNGQGERINRLYTHLTFCFASVSPLQCSEIRPSLVRGLAALHKAFPWTAGRVVKRDDGLFAIRLPATSTTSKVVEEILTVIERPDINFDTLRAAGYPASLLHEDDLAPCPTLLPQAQEGGVPVLLIKTVLAEGGVLLTFAAQHGGMDMAGFVEVVRLFSKACEGKAFGEDEVSDGNAMRDWWMKDRINVAERQGASIEAETDSSAENTKPSSAPAKAPDLEWALFTISAATLASLKDSATRDITSGFVSSDDVLSAFIWQAITRAATPESPNETPESMKTALLRNVDLRRFLSLLEEYPGFVNESTTHNSSATELLSKPLGKVAESLRATLDAPILVEQFHQKVRQYNALPAAGTTKPDNEAKAIEVRLSSWANSTVVNSLDFGLGLGRPVAVRRPAFTSGAREGLVYFLPKTEEGDWIVMVCLKSDRMERLKGIVESVEGCEWIG